MKVNRSTFSKIKQQYEILRMKAAYIEAERAIMMNPNLTGFVDAHNKIEDALESAGWTVQYKTEEVSAEDFHSIANDMLGNSKNLTVRDVQIMELEAKLKNMEEKGREYMANEQYEELAELKDWYDATLNQLRKLKDGNAS